jgi:hypothetical protein
MELLTAPNLSPHGRHRVRLHEIGLGQPVALVRDGVDALAIDGESIVPQHFVPSLIGAHEVRQDGAGGEGQVVDHHQPSDLERLRGVKPVQERRGKRMGAVDEDEIERRQGGRR